MVMAKDALSTKEPEWGGPREKKWEENGKRAVVMVDGNVYGLVVMLASLCRRTTKSLNAQIYAAGLEVLFGETVETLESQEVIVNRPRKPLPKATSNEDVRTVAQQVFTLGDDA